MMMAPQSCHELLHEKPEIRFAVHNVIFNFFSQTSDDVTQVREYICLYRISRYIYVITFMYSTCMYVCFYLETIFYTFNLVNCFYR